MELDIHLVKKVSGGKAPSIADNPGAVAAALATGAVAGGPGGLGIAASGLVIAEGVNQVYNMAQNHLNSREPFMMDLSGNRIYFQ